MYGMYYSRTVVIPMLGNTHPACSAGPNFCSVATEMYWLVSTVALVMGLNPGSAAFFFFFFFFQS